VDALFTLTPADTKQLRAEATRARRRAALIGRMLTIYGPGPAGATCGDCAHLRQHEMAQRWYKCALGPQSGGKATDWRVRWPACGKFMPHAAPWPPPPSSN
jgi:hypothetical protein